VQAGQRTEEESGKEIESSEFGVTSSESEKEAEKDCIFLGDY
jgi:hypothetical protein